MVESSVVREVLDRALAEGRTALIAPESKRICDAYGIPTPPEGLAGTAAEAVELAGKLGLPVALKIASPDLPHKTEAGGVLTGLSDVDSVARGFDTVLANARAYDPGAAIA